MFSFFHNEWLNWTQVVFFLFFLEVKRARYFWKIKERKKGNCNMHLRWTLQLNKSLSMFPAFGEVQEPFILWRERPYIRGREILVYSPRQQGSYFCSIWRLLSIVLMTALVICLNILNIKIPQTLELFYTIIIFVLLSRWGN